MSCSSEVPTDSSPVQDELKFKIVTLDNYLSQSSRSLTIPDSVSVKNQFILSFATEADFTVMLNYLRSLSDEERIAYFDKIGFDGAYTIWSKADTELDLVLDECDEMNNDTSSIVNKLNDYRAKYNGALSVNEITTESDSIEVTPSLMFHNEDMALIGSINGYVIIEGKLIEPEESAPMQVKRNAHNQGFIKYKAEVCVKNGKYKSYLSFGRIGNNLAFKTQTYRKILWFTKHDNQCTYFGGLAAYKAGTKSGVSRDITNIKCGEYKIINSDAKYFSPRLDAYFYSFHCSKNMNNRATKTDKNVLVK